MFTKSERELIAKSLFQLEAIPSEKFITCTFTNEIDSCCAMGHLVRLNSKNPNDYSMKNCQDFSSALLPEENLKTFLPIRMLSARFLTPNAIDPYDLNFRDLSWINNDFGNYTQETPKERVIACLEDMLATEVVEA